MADEPKAEEPKKDEAKADTPAAESNAAATTGSLGSTATEETKPLDGPKVGGDGVNMHVKVYAPFRVYFDGTAHSISAVNDTGPFDILPRHHNFMTILNECDVVVRTEKGEEKIPIPHGIMHVKADQVVVFLDL